MDSYEATKIVYSRIQSLDPENASKIMGFLLIQDHGDKEMIRLAFGPETLLHNLIINAKTQLGLLQSKPNSATPSSPSTFNPISRPNPLSLSSISNPSSPSSNLWSLSNPMSPSSTSSPSYANIVSKNSNPGSVSGSLLSPTISSSSLSSAYHSSTSELAEKYQLQSHLSFLSDPKTDDLFDGSQSAYSSSLQKQSYSVPSMCFGAEDVNSGVGWKPCLYYSRGFCKNGSSCRFLHSGSINADGASVDVGSPSNVNVLEQCQELLRSNAATQQQKQAAVSHFMAGGTSFPYNKCMNFFMQQQNDTKRSATSTLMMGDELHKFGRYQYERNDISTLTLGGNVNHSSRQIYLTFPADSTFREEDVSNYFSIYGPVQDVRIPYQQKRMFGFVTFVYSETVKIILAKGNPHFVCDSRVLVKPYKEKGKIPDKKQQHQQLERGDHHICTSLSGIDSREPSDLNLGSRMFYNTHEMLRRKLEEQANLQQAIELQERRLMNLQLLGIKSNNHHHNQHQYYHGLSEGSPFPSPTLSHTPKNQSLIVSPNGNKEEVLEEFEGSLAEQLQQEMVNPAFNLIDHGSEDDNGNDFDLLECMEHILPDNLFASPKKSAADQINAFSTTTSAEVSTESTRVTTISSYNNNNNLLPTTSTSSNANATSPKSVLSKCPAWPAAMGRLTLLGNN
ncbi:unnamed protein product [Prunus armeniaca]|uniref:C3H1-type domain-containing protein n=1 Tax=Prunus armeniaca TaxID=36596 RepID=A0A6J5UTH3_PRUAR|nr:unnamed protein product [Prunus armeniaca]